MSDPVVCSDGNTYERSAIEKWFQQGHRTSPKTNVPLPSTDLIPNIALRAAIEAWKANNASPGATPPAVPGSSASSPPPAAAAAAAAVSVRAPPAPASAGVTVAAVGYREAGDAAFVHLSVTPPADGPRRPCALVCVIDISGSMGSLAALPEANAVERSDFTRMDLVVHSIKTIVTVLGPQDQIALVTFSDEAKTVQPLVRTTDDNKKRVLKLLDGLSPDGCTNLWAGLKQGLDIARSEACASANVATLLFTDGLPNRNPPRGIQAELRAYLAKLRPSCTLHTFGYGYELDSALLRDIARSGNGVYGYIPDSTMVGTTFVNMVSNAVAVYARNVRLQLTPEPKAGIVEVEVVGFDSDGGETSVGVLQYGQTRSFMVRLRLEKAAADAFLQRPTAAVLSASASWEDGAGRQAAEVDVRGLPALDEVQSAELGVQRCRVLQTQSVKDAMASANGGDLKSAQEVVKKTVADIRAIAAAAGAASDERVKALLTDLQSDDANAGQIGKAFSNDKWYTTWGRHYLPALVQAHLLQQCHNFKDPGVQSYGGRLFREVQDLANEAFCTLPPPKPSGQHLMASLAQTSGGGGGGGAAAAAAARPKSPVNMRKYMARGGGCFDGAGRVRMASGQEKLVRDLRRGDVLAGGHRVVCLVRTPATRADSRTLLIDVGGLLLTPWHPVRIADEWRFPAEMAEAGIAGAYVADRTPVDGFVYNLVLDGGHVAPINGVEVVTLGHGFTDNSVVAHPYYGSRRVVDDLKTMPGWSLGMVSLSPETRHDPVSGLVSGVVPLLPTSARAGGGTSI